MRLLPSLTNRVFLASALLAVVSIAVAVIVVNARVTQDAERGLQRGLEDTAALLGDWQATLSDNYQLATRLLADSPKLKAAIDTGDPRTVAPLAREYRLETRADVLIVTDSQDRPLSVVGRWVSQEPPPVPGADAVEGQAVVSYWPHPDGVLQVVTVPVVIGSQRLGGVSVGFLFDAQRATRLRERTESEVAFAVGGRVLAASVPAQHFPSLAGALRRKGISGLSLGGEEYVALVRPFPDASGQAAALVFQSRTERLRFLRDIHAALALTAILAVLGAIVLAYLVARTVTRPLAAITAGMREIARTGDLTRKVSLPAGGWGDEDARLLASTFNTLTDSIVTFQREAAQRERLSSLGRLSTVIAHEIRNPLMIIKASVRNLRRRPLEEADVREAAGDIGEEVERLNRIVGGVLDLARPIRFDMAPTDLRALCEQSIAAASADGRGPAVGLVGGEGLPRLTTDAERLRSVLVNLILNARQAVLARREREASAGGEDSMERPGEPHPTDVELRLLRLAPDRTAIDVVDRGVGIPESQMARIFEPYFTSKAGGTGLGLAIARNVIDGLGGSIAVESREGQGTRVRIELPDGRAGQH